MKSYLELIKIDIKLALRQRTVIFFNYLFPLIFFFTFGAIFRAGQSSGAMTQVLTMSLTLGILGSGLFGAGMRAIQEREMSILRRYKVTPITPAPLLVASMVTGCVVFLPYVVLMLALSHYWYGMEWPARMTSVMIFVALGLVAFRAIGLVVASVANTMQEGTILVQLLYFPMLFLSGATFPAEFFGTKLQIISNFIPATYVVKGFKGILLQDQDILHNWEAVGALIITTIVGFIVGMKLFRWEKEEKIKSSSKLWVVGVILPFLAIGVVQSITKGNARSNKILARQMARGRNVLITGARIIVGDGKVIEVGAVLVRNGKIAEVYDTPPVDTKSLNAEVIEAAGKSVLPGLIDMHVHLGSPGGVFQDPQNFQRTTTNIQRELAAYLYSGVTAVKSVGDQLDLSLKTRSLVNDGEILGAELFACGPLFTTDGGHGTEYAKYLPTQTMRDAFNAQFTRRPKSAAEAKQQVEELKAAGVDGIKAILEAGSAGTLFNRMDPVILNAIAEQARTDKLPVTVHTGESRDVADALAAGANGIEHGSARDVIPDSLFAQIAKNGVFYDPTLSFFEAFGDLSQGKDDLLKRSLVQQVIPSDLRQGTESLLANAAKEKDKTPRLGLSLATAQANLLQAYKNHVLLVAGTDAGNLLVIHGPTVQHELELWVKAGIPAELALQAATYNAARFLGAENRIGTVRKGNEANLLIVEGNPIQDISALERVSRVIFKGEVVDRSELLNQE